MIPTFKMPKITNIIHINKKNNITSSIFLTIFAIYCVMIIL